MTDATTEPAIPAFLESSEYDQFMLRDPAEIRMVLRGLFDRLARITVFFNAGQDMLLTMLVAVEKDHLVLDFGPDENINRKAIAADRHFCVSQLDKVRVQFVLRGFARIDHEGRPAFRAPLPDGVLRLQRREFYRLVTPIVRPLKCLVPIPQPPGTIPHEATIFDISGGGVGLAAPPEGLPFAPGMSFSDCRIELPEVGTVVCTVKVCSLFEVTLRNGAVVRRAGCGFVDLPGPMMTLIQRYIIKVERERKARESGLGF